MNFFTFFSNSDFPSRICCHFFRTTLFWQKLLLHAFSKYFDTTVIFSGQLFLHKSCCFLLFQNRHFFGGVIFTEQLIFGAKILQSSHFLRIGGSLQQLFFRKNCVGQRYLKKGYFFKAGTSGKHQPFQKSYILEKTDFSENQFPHYLLFLESCLFRATTFSKDATFYSSYLFRRATFLQHTFSEELLFHS